MPIVSSEVIDRLCGTFQPVYTKWEQSMLADSGLWELTRGKSMLAILELDVRSLGEYFATADAQGSRTEFALLAECIAHIRLRESQLPKQAVFESEIDKVFRELSSVMGVANGTNIKPQIAAVAPVSWRIAHTLATRGKCSPSSYEGLAACFTDIASLFVLRDGNITQEEDQKLKAYHATFG